MIGGGNALTIFPFKNFKNDLRTIPFFYSQICSNIYIFFICNKFKNF